MNGGKLRILRLKVRNVRCFDSEEFSFTGGNNALLGSNGSGKSTVINSIGVALFGNSYLTGSSLKINDLVKVGKKSGEIELEYLTSKGRYKSQRQFGRSNKWRLYKKDAQGDFRKLTDGVRETEGEVLKTFSIEMTSKVFKNAICGEQGKITELLDLTPKERTKLVYKILGVEEYLDLNDHVRNIRREIETRQELLVNSLKLHNETAEDPKALQKELKDLETKLEKLRKDRAGFRTKFNNSSMKSKELNELKSKREKISGSISTNQKSLASKKAELDRLQKELVQLLGLDKLSTKKEAEIQKEHVIKKEELGHLTEKRHEIQSKVSTYTEKSNLLKKEEEQLSAETRQKASLEKQLQGVMKEGDKEYLQSKRDEFGKQIHMHEKDLENYREKITSEELKKQKVLNEVNRIRSRIKDFETRFTNSFKKPFSMIEEIKAVLTDAHASEREKLEVFMKKRDAINSEIGEITSKLEEAKSVLEVLSSADAAREHCPTCMREFEGINIDSLKQTHSQRIEEMHLRLKEIKEGKLRNSRQIDEIKLLDQELADRISKLQNFEKEHSRISEDKAVVLEKENELEELEQRIKSIHVDMAELQKVDLDGLRRAHSELNKKINLCFDLEKKIGAKETEIRLIRQNISSLKEELKGIDLDKLLEMVDEVKENIKVLEKRIKFMENNLLPKLDKIGHIREDIPKVEKEIADAQSQLEDLPTVNEEELQNLTNALTSISNEIGGINAQIVEIEKEKMPSITQRKKEAESKQLEIQELKLKIERYSEAYSAYDKMSRVLEKMPKILLASITERVSSIMTQKVRSMYPDRNFGKIEFLADGEIQIHRGGHIISPNKLSGGEKMAVGLALRIALTSEVAPLDFMILDEPTNFLDSQRVDEFLEILQNDSIFSRKSSQLLLVTHREEFEKSADNVIELKIDASGRRRVNGL